MKRAIIFLLMWSCTLTSCKKQDIISGQSFAAGTLRVTSGIRFPTIPRVPLPAAMCMYSYQGLLEALGNNTVNISAVVLANGITIQPGADLNTITYEATASTQPNSIFDSRLVVEWRWPGGEWQLGTADVWSLGCVYDQYGQPPYTNLIKGHDTLFINTCFYWSTNEFTGERINYLIIQ